MGPTCHCLHCRSYPRATRLDDLRDERFGLVELLALEADGTRWADADHGTPGLDWGATARRRDRLRAADVAVFGVRP
jgi:hypothetical protein